MTAGTIRVGVGGWTFAPWRGPFYPEGLPHKRELEYAAQRLTAIEINATFHKLQKPESFAAWAAATPEHFRFAVKGSRFVTNRRVLADAGEALGRFFGQGLDRLGDKLGPILWQFMPTKRFDRDDMARFLDLLPRRLGGRELRHVLEPRHESFAKDDFLALARDRDIAVCFSDGPDYPLIDADTADFRYARIRRAQQRLKAGYSAADLDALAQLARDWSAPGKDVWLFFIAAAKVRNPSAAQALIRRLAK